MSTNHLLLRIVGIILLSFKLGELKCTFNQILEVYVPFTLKGIENYYLELQRLLIVPPELAYGSKGVQEIPPNATIEVLIIHLCL